MCFKNKRSGLRRRQWNSYSVAVVFIRCFLIVKLKALYFRRGHFNIEIRGITGI